MKRVVWGAEIVQRCWHTHSQIPYKAYPHSSDLNEVSSRWMSFSIPPQKIKTEKETKNADTAKRWGL